jgi:hypothetical protein
MNLGVVKLDVGRARRFNRSPTSRIWRRASAVCPTLLHNASGVLRLHAAAVAALLAATGERRW